MLKEKKGFVLEELSVEDLTSLIASAEQLRQDKIAVAKRDLLDEMKARASKLGLALEDLLVVPTSRKSQSVVQQAKVAAKYRGPNNEEWSGRGRAPRWLAALEATGHHRTEFAIAA